MIGYRVLYRHPVSKTAAGIVYRHYELKFPNITVGSFLEGRETYDRVRKSIIESQDYGARIEFWKVDRTEILLYGFDFNAKAEEFEIET